MKKITWLVWLFIVFSCNNQKENIAIKSNRLINENILPFKATIVNSDYSTGENIQYTITEKDISISYNPGFVGSKDTVIYYKTLHPTENLKRISETDLDTLKEDYVNTSVKDGTQIFIKFMKQNKEKYVSISNFYQPNIGQLIELVNTQVPKKFEISYKKEFMVHPELR